MSAVLGAYLASNMVNGKANPLVKSDVTIVFLVHFLKLLGSCLGTRGSIGEHVGGFGGISVLPGQLSSLFNQVIKVGIGDLTILVSVSTNKARSQELVELLISTRLTIIHCQPDPDNEFFASLFPDHFVGFLFLSGGMMLRR